MVAFRADLVTNLRGTYNVQPGSAKPSRRQQPIGSDVMDRQRDSELTGGQAAREKLKATRERLIRQQEQVSGPSQDQGHGLGD